VLLRPWHRDDVDALVEACSDGEIVRWTPVPPRYGVGDARAYLERCERLWRTGQGAAFAIVGAATGELLGAVDVRRRATSRAAIGYWLGASARGRGIATRAVRLVSAWAFDAFALRRLELTTDPANAPSQRVALRVGFTRETVLRRYVKLHGERRDSVLFALARESLAG
jgi:RimJ/RimL family protein N-acetyltransferase